MDDEEYDLEEDTRSSNNETGMDKFMNFLKENTKLVIVAVVIILLLIIMSIVGGGGGSDTSGITISQSSLTITAETGNQVKLMKDGKELTGVVWSSNDPSIATVDKSGVIKGVRVGKTTIVGKYNDKEYKCEVTVSEGDGSLKVESLKFSESGTILMPVGSTYQVPIQITPSEAKFKNKIFASSNPQIASIDINSGLITANAKGNAMIRVAVNDAEKMASIKIIVVEGQITPGIYTLPTSLAFDEKEITLTEGDTKTLTYHQEPPEASTDYVMWVSADEEVATVFNGELIAKKPGNIEVAIVSMGLKDTMVVHVKSGTVPATGVNIASETNITMNVGDQKQIIATVEPSNATNQVVTYLVDNPSVVSVDSEGNISAIGSGSTTITVSPSANLDIKKTIYVTVNDVSTYEPPADDGGSDGDGTSDKPKVGSVIISGTNNSVSVDVNGIEVESTVITMSGSGNVDEIRYCYYNKATSSSCTMKNIYGGEFELPQTKLSTKTTYVIKAVPYYQAQKGTEVTRYVTIKPSDGGGSNPPDDDTTPPAVGEKRCYVSAGSSGVSSNFVWTTKPSDSNMVEAKAIPTESYCENARKGYLCFKDSAGNYYWGTNFSTSTTYQYLPEYKNQQDCLAKNPQDQCYCSSDGRCKWGTKDSIYTKNVTQSTGVGKNDCENYIKGGNGNEGCFWYGDGLVWGRHMGMSGYSYRSGVTKDKCVNTSSYKCYFDSSIQKFEWTNSPKGNQKEAKALPTESNCENARKGYLCFKDSSGKNHWGYNYSLSSNYTYLEDKKTVDKCEYADASITNITYKVSKSDGSLKFTCTSSPSKVCSDNVTWSSSEKSIIEFTDKKKGIAKINGFGEGYTITATAGNGAKYEKTYGYLVGMTYYDRLLYSNSMKTYSGYFGNKYPMLAFSLIKSNVNHNGISMCYYVRGNGTPTLDEIKSKCDFTTSKLVDGYDRTFVNDNVEFYTVKLVDQGKVYRKYGPTYFKNNSRQAFEFGYVSDTELRNNGSNSEYIIFALSPNYSTQSSSTYLWSNYELLSVFKIKIGTVNANDDVERYKDWTITDITDVVNKNSFTN